MTTGMTNGRFHNKRNYALAWQAVNRDGFHPIVLSQPYGVVFSDEGKVAVAEGFWPYSRIQFFDAETGMSVQRSSQNEILPFGIAVVDNEKTIAVTDHHDRTVKFLSQEGRQVAASWESDRFDWPTGIAVDHRGVFYIVDWLRGTACLCDDKGTTIRSFSTKGPSKSSFPVYLAVDSHRRLIVTDSFNHCISIFDEAGTMLRQICLRAERGTVADPRGVCIDERDNIIVADCAQGTVQKYSPHGVWIEDLLSEEDQITHPWGVAVDKGILALTEQKLGKQSAVKLFEKLIPG